MLTTSDTTGEPVEIAFPGPAVCGAFFTDYVLILELVIESSHDLRNEAYILKEHSRND